MRLIGNILFLLGTIGNMPACASPVVPSMPHHTSHCAAAPGHKQSAVQRTVWRDGMVHGVLSNGLNYYLIPTPKGTQNMEIRLALPVGSYVETTKGVAHFIEHLAFDGTALFPHKNMVRYWERLGMKYGRDINAFTGHDRTVYTLTHPLGSTAQTDTTLHALSQWLGAMQFAPDMIEQERSIIQSEQQAYQTDDAFYPLKIGNGTDCGLPIGTAEEIQRIQRSDLLQYYRKWYQPQYASLIIAGDLHTEVLEEMIIRHFAPLHNTSAHTLPHPTLQYAAGVTLHSLTDTFARRPQLELIIPHRTKVPHTLQQAAEYALRQQLAHILRRRLQRHAVDMEADNSWYLYDTEHLTFTIRTDSLPILLQGVTLAAGELRLMARRGLTAAEWQELRNDLSARTTRTRGEAAFLADEWSARAVQGDTLRTDMQQEAYIKAVQQLHNSTVRRLAKQWWQAAQAHLLAALTLPGKHTFTLTSEDIKKAWQKGYALRLALPTAPSPEPQTDSIALPTHLLAPTPTDSTVLARHRYPTLGISELLLPNGIRLLIRPTESDRITVVLIGRGGTADLSDKDHALYDGTAAYMDMGGTQRIQGDRYSRLILQEDIAINPGIGAYHHQLMGTAPAEKMHLLFRLMREKICEPELCREEFEQVRSEALQRLGTPTTLERMLTRNADYRMERYIDRISGILEPQRPSQTADNLRAQNLDSMAAWYSRLFTQSPGTAILVLGNIPSEGRLVAEINKAFGDFSVQADSLTTAPSHTVSYADTMRFVDMERRDTELNRIYTGTYTGTLRTELTLKLVRDLIQQRLIDILREQHRLTYSPYVTMQQSGIPGLRYSFRICCATRPEHEQQAFRLLDSIAHSLRTDLVSAHELQTLKTSFLTTKAAVLHDAATAEWRDLLLRLVEQGIPIAEYAAYDSVLQSISPEEIRQACMRYLQAPHDVVMQPAAREGEKAIREDEKQE